MSESLRIAVADDEPKMRAYFQDTLAVLGHQVVAVAENGRQLVEQCRSSRPDLIITDIKMPDMDGLQAASEIRSENAIPFILVSAYSDREFIDRALQNYVLAYLIKPIKQAELETAIALVMRRFKEFEILHQRTEDLRQALEDRKIIERAKGVLMKRAGLAEDEAFRRVHMEARKKNQKMVDVAKMILSAEEMLSPQENT